MHVGWDKITMVPGDDAKEALRIDWSWLLPERYQPLLFSALGDMFFEAPTGEIFWLNTGTAETSAIATSRREFQRLTGTEAAMDWFLPPLIEKLIQAGKILKPGQCYTFVTLPVFAGGTYTAENLNPVDAKEHFGITAHIHRQILNLQDGAKVRLKIE